MLIESTFGLNPLTARDKHARNLQDILLPAPVPGHRAVQPTAILFGDTWYAQHTPHLRLTAQICHQ